MNLKKILFCIYFQFTGNFEKDNFYLTSLYKNTNLVNCDLETFFVVGGQIKQNNVNGSMWICNLQIANIQSILLMSVYI